MADNAKLRTFIDRFRVSEQFAAKKTADFLNSAFAGTKIAVLNKIQMSKGVDSEGEKFGSYSEGWGKYRETKGLQTKFVDLKFTGKFYDSIKVDGKLKSAKKPEMVFGADKERLDNLSEQDRFDLALGLTPENRDKVAMMIASHVRNELLNYYKV